MTRPRTLALAVMSVTLLFAGCGDSDDSGSGSGGGGDRLTKAEFVSQADAICKDADERSEEVEKSLEEKFGDAEEATPEQLQEALNAITPIFDDTFDKLDNLNPPADLEADYNSVIADGRKAAADLKAAADGSAKDLEEYLTNTDDPFEDIDERFGALGLKECGAES